MGACCNDTPSASVPLLAWVAVAATCSTTSCGEASDTPGDAGVYRTITTTRENGHTSTRTYTFDEVTGCDWVTTCAGSDVTTREVTVEGFSESYETLVSFVPGPSGGYYESRDGRVTNNIDPATLNETTSFDYDTDCNQTYSCEGSASTGASGSTTEEAIVSATGEIIYPATDFSYSVSCNSELVFVSGFDCAWESTTTTQVSPDEFGISGTVEGNSSCPVDSESGSRPFTETITEPGDPVTRYSDPESLEPCELDFPTFPTWASLLDDDTPPPLGAGVTAGQGASTGTALRDHDDESLTRSETKLKWRILHAPQASCYLKVWLEKVSYSETNVETISSAGTYTWSGTPCVADLTVSVGHKNNEIRGSENTLTLEENGRAFIRILKYSCVDGYTPATNAESGYPPAL